MEPFALEAEAEAQPQEVRAWTRARAESAPAGPVAAAGDEDGSPLKREAQAVAGRKGNKQAAAAQAAKEKRRLKRLQKTSQSEPEPEPGPMPEPAPDPAPEPNKVRGRIGQAFWLTRPCTFLAENIPGLGDNGAMSKVPAACPRPCRHS